MAAKLSICIATFKRARFIGETLDSILPQLTPDVELVIVDGASPDGTAEVVSRYVARSRSIRYYREKENQGVDRDYDRAVTYALGEYCWLMTDDDILKPGSIRKIMESIERGFNLIVVNSEIRTSDLSKVLEGRRLKIDADRSYEECDVEALFRDAATYLSFIGGVVIKRKLWLERDRASYFGTEFIHVGVIFQKAGIGRALLVAEPQIAIRFGNAMWSSRGFQIWMFKWPDLVWSFRCVTDASKKTICARHPWKSAKALFYYRALGVFTEDIYWKMLANRSVGFMGWVARLIAAVPVAFANFLGIAYCYMTNGSKLDLYDLLRCRESRLRKWMLKFVHV